MDSLIGSWDRWLSGSQSNPAQPREDLNVRDAGATAGAAVLSARGSPNRTACGGGDLGLPVTLRVRLLDRCSLLRLALVRMIVARPCSAERM